jgi:hypothetical protein
MKHDFSSISTTADDVTRVDSGYFSCQLNNVGKLRLMDVFNRRLKAYHAMSSALAHATGYTVVHVP